MKIVFILSDKIEAIERARSVLSTIKPMFASYHRRNGGPSARKLKQVFEEVGFPGR